jgi:signal transduction histidine kinase
VKDTVESALELSRPLIEAKQHALHVELAEPELRFMGDPLRLAQIVSNLLTNAAKYTDYGGDIRLWAGCSGKELLIRVSDNGIGIDSDMLSKVFDMFSQAAPALERTEGGLGVGLALVRGFVELHGGSVHARSEGRGRGSTFTVRLPLTEVHAAVPETGPIAPVSAPASRLKVLVVDDNRDTAETLASLIRLHGYEVRAP